MNDRNHAWRADLIAACAIVMVASAVRLALVLISPAFTPVADMADYWERAIYIVQHGTLYPTSHRMPAYPAALALAFALGSGPSLTTVRLFNVVAGAATAVLTYWLARRTAGPRASFAAGLVVALYPSLLIYSTLIATEMLIPVPLLGALIASTYRSRRAAIAAGLCAGLAALARPAAIGVLPAVFVSWSGMRSPNSTWRPALVAPLLVLGAFALTMSPWWVHNAKLYGRFVPLDTTGGMSLAIGNNEVASGIYRWRETREMMDRHLVGVNVDTPAGSDRATAVAVRFMREHPGAAIRLIPLRLAALFGVEGREHAWLYSFGFFGERTSTTVQMWALAIALAFPLLLAAALLGLSVGGGISKPVLLVTVLFLAFTIGMHAISIGDPRFHIPLVPVLAVLATGVAHAKNGFSRIRLAAAAVAIALLAVAWSAQFATYWAALAKLAPPGGWMSHIPYDDLM